MLDRPTPSPETPLGPAAIAARKADLCLRVAGRVREARRHVGLSQETVADALGVTFQQVQKYENGSNRISCGSLVLLAELLDRDIGWFFDAPAPPEAADMVLRVDHLFVREGGPTPYIDEADRFTRDRAAAIVARNPEMSAARAADFADARWLSRAGLIAALARRDAPGAAHGRGAHG